MYKQLKPKDDLRNNSRNSPRQSEAAAACVKNTKNSSNIKKTK